MSHIATSFPSTGFVDILRLLGRCAWSFVRGPSSFDFGAAFQEWIGGLARRTGSDNFVLNLYFKKFLLVTGRDLTAHILSQPPDAGGYTEGRTKSLAMSFLAPQALTVTHGEQWRRLRKFNEATLYAREADARLQLVLEGVRNAFPEPVSDVSDIRRGMERSMQAVVFGRQVPDRLAEDVQELFRYVQHPGRRMLFGWSQAGRRRRFYGALRQLWAESSMRSAPCLIATAKDIAHDGMCSDEEMLQQIPHWMFTFTGSGTDLLTRTLAMVSSRDEVYEKVRAEIGQPGSANGAIAVMRMGYLESCLLETCRLFPPVSRTFHVAPQGDVFRGVNISAGMEILHCFTANQRDVSVDATANDFRPERWMEPGSVAAAVYPGLFLGGARDCPGKDLILFVCKAAIATLMSHGRIRSQCPALSEHPVPVSFPKAGLRFDTDAGRGFPSAGMNPPTEERS